MHILRSASLWILALVLLAVGEALHHSQAPRGGGKEKIWTGNSTTPALSGSN